MKYISILVLGVTILCASSACSTARLSDIVLQKSDLPDGFTVEAISKRDDLINELTDNQGLAQLINNMLIDAYQVKYSFDDPYLKIRYQEIWCTAYSWKPDNPGIFNAPFFYNYAIGKINMDKVKTSNPGIGDESLAIEYADGLTVTRIIWWYKTYDFEIVSIGVLPSQSVDLVLLARTIQERIERFDEAK